MSSGRNQVWLCHFSRELARYRQIFFILIQLQVNFQTYQLMLDRSTPFTAGRWIFTVVLIIAFMARVLIAQVCLFVVGVALLLFLFACSGMVYRHVRTRHLSPQPSAGLPHPQDRPGHGGV